MHNTHSAVPLGVAAVAGLALGLLAGELGAPSVTASQPSAPPVTDTTHRAGDGKVVSKPLSGPLSPSEIRAGGTAPWAVPPQAETSDEQREPRDSDPGATPSETTSRHSSALDGRAILTGQSGTPFLHQATWRQFGIATPRIYLDVPPTSALYRQQYRRLESTAKLGLAPWARDRFQILTTSFDGLGVIGRDFSVPSSPHATAEWVEMRRGKALTGTDREELLRRLESFQAKRRELVSSIFRRVSTLRPDHGTTEFSGLYVTADQAYIVSPGSVPELDTVSVRVNEILTARANSLDGVLR